jgi:hypothetical protein
MISSSWFAHPRIRRGSTGATETDARAPRARHQPPTSPSAMRPTAADGRRCVARPVSGLIGDVVCDIRRLRLPTLDAQWHEEPAIRITVAGAAPDWHGLPVSPTDRGRGRPTPGGAQRSGSDPPAQSRGLHDSPPAPRPAGARGRRASATRKGLGSWGLQMRMSSVYITNAASPQVRPASQRPSPTRRCDMPVSRCHASPSAAPTERARQGRR